MLDGEGYIATNAHVVTATAADQAQDVYVELSDGNRVGAKIVGGRPERRRRAAEGRSGRSVAHAAASSAVSHRIAVGPPVAAIGSPFGERQSLSVGVISAVDRNIESLTQFSIGDAIQTDAAINPGNSGGPLLDGRARCSASTPRSSPLRRRRGRGVRDPVDTVRRSLRELRRNGRVGYGYLGVQTLAALATAGQAARPGRARRRADPAGRGRQSRRERRVRAGNDQLAFQAQSIQTGGDVIVAVDGHR